MGFLRLQGKRPTDEAGKELTDHKAVRKVPGTYGLITELVGIIRKGIGEEESKN
jgi:hypothetical protein